MRTILFSCLSFLLFAAQFPQAFGADIFPFKYTNITDTIAENAGGPIFLQHNGGPVYINFHSIFFANVQRTTQLDRQNNSTQLVHFSYDTGRLHNNSPQYVNVFAPSSLLIMS